MLKIGIGKQNCECSCCRWRYAHLQLFAEGYQAAVSIYENGWGGGGETSGGLPRIRSSIHTKNSIIICFSSNSDHFVFAIRYNQRDTRDGIAIEKNALKICKLFINRFQGKIGIRIM